MQVGQTMNWRGFSVGRSGSSSNFDLMGLSPPCGAHNGGEASKKSGFARDARLQVFGVSPYAILASSGWGWVTKEQCTSSGAYFLPVNPFEALVLY